MSDARNPLLDPRAGDVVADPSGNEITVLAVLDGHVPSVSVLDGGGAPTEPATWSLGAFRVIVAGGRVIHAAEGQA